MSANLSRVDRIEYVMLFGNRLILMSEPVENDRIDREVLRRIIGDGDRLVTDTRARDDNWMWTDNSASRLIADAELLMEFELPDDHVIIYPEVFRGLSRFKEKPPVKEPLR